MKLTESKLRKIIREEILKEAIGKSQLKKMIVMAKKAGARRYDIVKSLASDLSKSEKDIVGDLERHNLLRMTEINEKLRQVIREMIKEVIAETDGYTNLVRTNKELEHN